MDMLNYTKAEKIYIKNYFDEKWVQDRIEEDPTIIGLGEINIIERERKQSSGGRIDFLFHDPEKQIMYETEIMLGSTDESHIIRTIEYWDIESRRFPSKEHKAVIIAEDITNRFFNVISLMNKSIPIIAIQLNALKLDDKIILNFTKVLDIYESPEDEEDLGSETVGRDYWESRSNKKSISIVDQIIEIIQTEYSSPKVTYNKNHIAIGTHRRNFMWCHPRKKEGYCHFDIKVGNENLDRIKTILDDAELSYNNRKKDIIAISLHLKDLKEQRELFENLFIDSLKNCL